jgi:hypothetical protein
VLQASQYCPALIYFAGGLSRWFIPALLEHYPASYQRIYFLDRWIRGEHVGLEDLSGLCQSAHVIYLFSFSSPMFLLHHEVKLHDSENEKDEYLVSKF